MECGFDPFLIQQHSSNFRIMVAGTTALRRVFVKLAKQGDFTVTQQKKTASVRFLR
jgi:hypothetical protein